MLDLGRNNSFPDCSNWGDLCLLLRYLLRDLWKIPRIFFNLGGTMEILGLILFMCFIYVTVIAL